MRAVNPLRSVLLAASQNAWLREQATRRRFVRRAGSRFMPGEALDEALDAARVLHPDRFATIVTQLGENVTDLAEAEAGARPHHQGERRNRAAPPHTRGSG